MWFFFFQSNLLCFLAGLGGACGYLIGAMDWGHSALGVVLGSEYQVIYFFSSLTWGIFLTMHLFSIQRNLWWKITVQTLVQPPRCSWKTNIITATARYTKNYHLFLKWGSARSLPWVKPMQSRPVPSSLAARWVISVTLNPFHVAFILGFSLHPISPHILMTCFRPWSVILCEL